MNPNNQHISPLALMPRRDGKHAPEFFKGDYKKVTRFIEHYKFLLESHHVTSEADKCRGILEYCSPSVQDFIQGNPHYITPDWQALQKEILDIYDAERMEIRVHPSEFYRFLDLSRKKTISHLSQWKKYHRRYLSLAGHLKRSKHLEDDTYQGYYWYGIPRHLQGILELKLQARYPNFDSADPWPISAVREAAKTYFK